MVARAFRVAMQGRPGPVVISLPEDILTEMSSVADAPRVEPADTAPSDADMKALGDMVKAAKKPFMIVGGSRWTAAACKSVADFAARAGIPVAASFRRAQLFPADHPNFAGDLGIGPNPKLAARIKEADLLLLVGGRMSEMPSSSYTLIDVPVPKQKLVHVHPGAEELGRVYQPALAIQASPIAFAAKLAALDIRRARQCGGGGDRARGLSRLVRQSAQTAGALPVWRGDVLAARPPAAGLRSSATAPATSPAGSTASSASASTARSLRRPRARWAMACRRR